MRLPEIPTLPTHEFEIPIELAGLRGLIYNLWWSWSPRAHRLFSRIDSARWLRYRNPVQLLIALKPHRWDQLLIDRDFMALYHEVVEEFEQYLARAGEAWFPSTHPDYRGGPIAYFSTEFGWHDSVGIYSGGLGILSGDHCKSASDEGVPMIGIGLMYRRGYFRQTIDPDGFQQHFYPDYDLRRLPVLPVADAEGRELRVGVELPGRQVRVRAWKAQVGRIPVLLLDSDIGANRESDRPITHILYVQGREMRLCQEILLGVGGVRLLRALGIRPSVWHMNEGHSALLSIERIRERVQSERIPFDEALRRTSGNAVFTTHTPVPAGNETFDRGLVRRYLEPWEGACGTSVDALLDLGIAHPGGSDRAFNLTALAIRTSSETNGVSELHGRVANDTWRHLKAEPGSGRLAVGHVTNGVHVASWIGPEMRSLLEAQVGPDVLDRLLEPGFEDAVRAVPDVDLWEAHLEQKKRLVLFTRERVRQQFARHGRSPEELARVEGLLDPEILTIGFARRFATYKRAALMFRDLDRLRRIVADGGRAVQILFAGKAHPADRPGQNLIREICRIAQSQDFQGRVLFLEDYDMRIARFLVQGVDLWLNNPRRPQEASGTSGMKVAANGGLNCSVPDGWWCEGYDPSHGWVIGDVAAPANPEEEDATDADALYRVLADEIVPEFYRRDPDSGLPVAWIARMKNALAALAPRFSTARMLREYAERYYLPASRREGWGSEFDEVRLWTT